MFYDTRNNDNPLDDHHNYRMHLLTDGFYDEVRRAIAEGGDNGGDPHAGHRPLPYRGGKGGQQRSNLQWEGNYRMPTILAFPGTLPAGTQYQGIDKTA